VISWGSLLEQQELEWNQPLSEVDKVFFGDFRQAWPKTQINTAQNPKKSRTLNSIIKQIISLFRDF
jgi:hypothetical protein